MNAHSTPTALSTANPLRPRTFAEYRSEMKTMTPPGVKPLLADMSVHAVQWAINSQVGSTFRTIPWTALTSWNGWQQCPDGIQYSPAIHTSGPASHARIPYKDLPVNGRFKDAAWLIPAAIGNGIISNSTFASTQHVSSREQRRVMAGYDRIIKATIGIKL
jgi:hypothetical protein